MPSVVAETFHNELSATLSAANGEMLDEARGGGPEYREMHRALMLADRAAREWAAFAIASERPGAPNHFEQLRQLGRPEDAHHELEPAAIAEAHAAASLVQRDIARAVQSLAAAVVQLDTESSAARNSQAFQAIGKAAADVLRKSADALDDEQFVVEQANQTLADLVVLAGWTNQLGPRFGR